MAGYEIDFDRLRGDPLAGMLSVLVHPFLALKQTGGSRTPLGLQEAAESW